MAYAKSDYFHWDNDLDLDSILGEYTCSSEEEALENVAVAPKVSKSCTEYKCPECEKLYKSISGIRGHLTGKHGYSKVNASDYLVGKPLHAKQERKTNKMGLVFCLQKSKFQELFTETVPKSLDNVRSNKFRKMESSVYGGAIVMLSNDIMSDTQSMMAMTDMLCEPFYKVFNDEPKQDVNTKEAIFMNYYDQTIDIIEPLTDLIIGRHGQDIPARQFAAAMLRQLLQDLITQRSAMYGQPSTEDTEPVSENDQCVLYYISGFLVHALSKRAKRLKPEEKQATYSAIEKMQAQKDEKSNSIAKKFSAWTEKLNRGGLKIPSEEMFLLVREIEHQSRKIEMLDLATRKESLMDKFMIKFYSERLMGGKYCSNTLERVISIFLTMRGNAIARKKKMELTDKKTKALRKSLKEITRN